MGTLSKAQILEAKDLKTEEVEVPEWGGSVTVRTMTGKDRDAFDASMVSRGADGKHTADVKNMRAKLVAMTLVDDKGELMFTEQEIGALANKSAAALERVFNAAQRLNGMAADSVEAAEKNS